MFCVTMSIFAFATVFSAIVKHNMANFCVTIRNGLDFFNNLLFMIGLADLPTSAKASSNLLFGHSVLPEKEFGNM